MFLDKVFAKLQTTGALPTGASFPAASVLSKMIANMNTEDGVRYNFSNANAWYICLGAKYGGLIIQGGASQPTAENYYDLTPPISPPRGTVLGVCFNDTDNLVFDKTSSTWDTSFTWLYNASQNKIRILNRVYLYGASWFAICV